MRVKKFTASTIPEALAAIKQEFGDDAIILHQKSYPKPILGLFGKSYVEVTAGLDEKPQPAKERPVANARKVRSAAEDLADRAERKNVDRAEFRSIPKRDISELQKVAQNILEKRNMPPSDAAIKLSASPPPLGSTANIPATAKAEEQVPSQPHAAFLASLAAESTKKKTSDSKSGASRSTGQNDRLARVECQISSLSSLFESFIKEQREAGRHPHQEWIDALTCRGLSRTHARELIEAVKPGDITGESLSKALAERILTTGPVQLPEEDQRPKVVLLVGPTGVGKTTTLSKMAATYAYALQPDTKPAKVVLLTADLYRMGAVEQLKEYAKILQVPLEKAYASDEVKDCIARHEDADLILIDTAGSSQRNEDQIEVLLNLAGNCQPCEIHLVVSATTKADDLVDVVKRFGVLKPNALIITKTDEATSLGSVYEALSEVQMPLSYITTGQMVPEDIETATCVRIAELILPAGFCDSIADSSTKTSSEQSENPQEPHQHDASLTGNEKQTAKDDSGKSASEPLGLEADIGKALNPDPLFPLGMPDLSMLKPSEESEAGTAEKINHA